MTAARSTTQRHTEQRSRATQLVCALIRDLQHGLGRLNPLRHVEPPPAAVDRTAERVLEFFREVSRDEARAVLQELLAELDADDLAAIARNHRPTT